VLALAVAPAGTTWAYPVFDERTGLAEDLEVIRVVALAVPLR
jgi:hypothetical protein